MGAVGINMGDPRWSLARHPYSQVVTLIDGENGNGDSSPQQLALTAIGAPTNTSTTPVAQGFSPLFNGTADGYKVGSDAIWGGGALDATAFDFEIEAKIRLTSLAAANNCVAATRANNAGVQGGWELVVQSTGLIYYAQYSGAASSDTATTPALAIAAGTTYDVRAWSLGGNIGIDVNGTNIQTTAKAFTMGKPVRGLRMGCREVAAASFTAFFPGRIELRITYHNPAAGALRYTLPYTPPASWVAG